MCNSLFLRGYHFLIFVRIAKFLIESLIKERVSYGIIRNIIIYGSGRENAH